MFTRSSKESQWKLVALGSLIIYYDSNIFGEKIILKADKTDEIVSNTIISMNTKMEVNYIILYNYLTDSKLINVTLLLYEGK